MADLDRYRLVSSLGVALGVAGVLWMAIMRDGNAVRAFASSGIIASALTVSSRYRNRAVAGVVLNVVSLAVSLLGYMSGALS